MSSHNNRVDPARDHHDDPMVEVPASFVRNLARTSLEVLRVLGPGALGAGHRLLVLDHQEWVDWPSLERDLIEWMDAGIQAEEPLPPERSEFFANGAGHVSVQVEYVVEDLWSVECLPAITNDSNELEPDLRKKPATASLTVPGSQRALPYGWHRSIA